MVLLGCYQIRALTKRRFRIFAASERGLTHSRDNSLPKSNLSLMRSVKELVEQTAKIENSVAFACKKEEKTEPEGTNSNFPANTLNQGHPFFPSPIAQLHSSVYTARIRKEFVPSGSVFSTFLQANATEFLIFVVYSTSSFTLRVKLKFDFGSELSLSVQS